MAASLGGYDERVSDVPASSGPWTRHTRRVAYDNPWVVVYHDEVTRPDGGPGIYGVVHFRNVAAGVVVLDPADRILLVGQHRYTLDEYSWEIPEGGVPPDEDPLEGARRELREETGIEAAEWAELARYTLSNSITDERALTWLAWGLSPAPRAPDETEVIAVARVPFTALMREIERGAIRDALTVATALRAYHMAREHLLPGWLAHAMLTRV